MSIPDDFVPEHFDPEYVTDIRKKIEKTVNLSPDSDQLFLNGFLRKCKPKKILEIGVHNGGGSALILNAIKDISEAHLYSVDKVELVDGFKEPIGHVVERDFPELLSNWTLHKGGIISDFIEDIGDGIDFCFLDAAHFFPGELLDFLVVLPYLKDHAMILLHDINFHLIHPGGFATDLLLNIVDERKWLAQQPKHNFINMGAFQIGNQKMKALYVNDLFRCLSLRWMRELSEREFKSVLHIFQKHYTNDQVDMFKIAYHLAVNKFLYDYPAGNLDEVLPFLKPGKKTVLFGAGRYGRHLLNALRKKGIVVDYFIDNDKEKIGALFEGVPVRSLEDIVAMWEEINLLLACTWISASQLMKQLSSTSLYGMIKNPVPFMP